jgi:PadR family transcriptional regulator PadR
VDAIHVRAFGYHGFQSIDASSEGTLYPLLSRMRREGLLDYEWKESETGPPRKYYELTAKSREQLRETLEYWDRINETVKQLGHP